MPSRPHPSSIVLYDSSNCYDRCEPKHEQQRVLRRAQHTYSVCLNGCVEQACYGVAIRISHLTYYLYIFRMEEKCRFSVHNPSKPNRSITHLSQIITHLSHGKAVDQ